MLSSYIVRLKSGFETATSAVLRLATSVILTAVSSLVFFSTAASQEPASDESRVVLLIPVNFHADDRLVSSGVVSCYMNPRGEWSDQTLKGYDGGGQSAFPIFFEEVDIPTEKIDKISIERGVSNALLNEVGSFTCELTLRSFETTSPEFPLPSDDIKCDNNNYYWKCAERGKPFNIEITIMYDP